MSQQQTDVDAITAQLTTFQSTLSSAVTSLTTADTNIAAEIATLAVAHPTLDLSALQAESSSLSSGLSSLSGIATASTPWFRHHSGHHGCSRSHRRLPRFRPGCGRRHSGRHRFWFTGATAVNFATVSATFTVVSDTTLNVIAPVGTDGTIVDVAVVTANGLRSPRLPTSTRI